MSIQNNFYVYEHRRKDTGVVFYVGKGCGKRAKNFCNRGRYWDNVAKAAGGVIVTYPVLDVDEELSYLAEIELIDVYRKQGVRLVNISDGGEGSSGWKPTEDVKRKIGEANKYTPKASGENHGMYGKKHSEESLAKMREAAVSREYNENSGFSGRKHTEESRAKMSENLKGTKVGQDNPFFGKTHTAESRLKMSKARLGKKVSDETCEKQRASAIASASEKQATRPVLCITNGQKYYGLSEASRQLGLHRQSIRMVCNGKLKQTGGYVFEWSTK
jgi:hypothetical protein